jgi:hypothetical protein
LLLAIEIIAMSKIMYDVYSSWRSIIMLVRTKYYDLFVGNEIGIMI